MKSEDVLRLLSAYMQEPTLWVEISGARRSFIAGVKPETAVSVADDLHMTLKGWGCASPLVWVSYTVGRQAMLMVTDVEDLPDGVFVLRESAPVFTFGGVGYMVDVPEEGKS